MIDPNTDNNPELTSATDPNASVPQELDLKESSSPKSPAKSDRDQDDSEHSNSKKPVIDREAQERAIQAFLRMKNEPNPSSKQKSPSKNDKPPVDCADADSDLEDSPQPRQRNDRVVFSPKDNSRSGSEVDFSNIQIHRLEKSRSIVESDIPKDYESLPRTYTQIMEKPAEHASLLLPARNSDITKSVNVGKDLKFMDKANWTDELKCYVCARSFNKMDGIFTHHCRACGKSVCGDCSTRKMNDNRACDVCFYKASNVLAEERRKNLLIEKTRMLKEYKKKAEDAQKYLQDLQQKKKELEKRIYDEREDQDKAFLVLQKEKLKVYENLDKKKSNNKKLKETLESEQAFLKKKEEATSEMKEVLNSIKIDLAEKRGNINSKQEENERLVSQKQYYEKSYYSCLEPKEEKDEKDDDENDVQRSSSIAESCEPNLPGTEEENNKEIEEQVESDNELQAQTEE